MAKTLGPLSSLLSQIHEMPRDHRRKNEYLFVARERVDSLRCSFKCLVLQKSIEALHGN